MGEAKRRKQLDPTFGTVRRREKNGRNSLGTISGVDDLNPPENPSFWFGPRMYGLFATGPLDYGWETMRLLDEVLPDLSGLSFPDPSWWRRMENIISVVSGDDDDLSCSPRVLPLEFGASEIESFAFVWKEVENGTTVLFAPEIPSGFGGFYDLFLHSVVDVCSAKRFDLPTWRTPEWEGLPLDDYPLPEQMKLLPHLVPHSTLTGMSPLV